LICNDRWNSALAEIPALDGAQFLIIPAYGSTSRAQDEAVIARARETRLPVIEANVGVTLIVSSGEPVATDRAEQTITFAEIEIPSARAAQPVERDSVEQAFLTWRAGEMAVRYERKKHRLTPEEIVAAAAP
jgi:predicted amidohydrolase